MSRSSEASSHRPIALLSTAYRLMARTLLTCTAPTDEQHTSPPSKPSVDLPRAAAASRHLPSPATSKVVTVWRRWGFHSGQRAIVGLYAQQRRTCDDAFVRTRAARGTSANGVFTLGSNAGSDLV
ncbi:unnamed protein product [Lampetra planeri]